MSRSGYICQKTARSDGHLPYLTRTRTERLFHPRQNPTERSSTWMHVPLLPHSPTHIPKMEGHRTHTSSTRGIKITEELWNKQRRTLHGRTEDEPLIRRQSVLKIVPTDPHCEITPKERRLMRNWLAAQGKRTEIEGIGTQGPYDPPIRI